MDNRELLVSQGTKEQLVRQVHLEFRVQLDPWVQLEAMDSLDSRVRPDK
jgi:hypothetical protein